jgi:hypothetical protein
VKKGGGGEGERERERALGLPLYHSPRLIEVDPQRCRLWLPRVRLCSSATGRMPRLKRNESDWLRCDERYYHYNPIKSGPENVAPRFLLLDYKNPPSLKINVR